MNSIVGGFLGNFRKFTEVCLEPSRTSTIALFCENSERLKVINYFRIKSPIEEVRLGSKYRFFAKLFYVLTLRRCTREYSPMVTWSILNIQIYLHSIPCLNSIYVLPSSGGDFFFQYFYHNFGRYVFKIICWYITYMKVNNGDIHRVKSVQIRSISPYSVRMRENTNQKLLRIWTLFTQWFCTLIISENYFWNN